MQEQSVNIVDVVLMEAQKSLLRINVQAITGVYNIKSYSVAKPVGYTLVVPKDKFTHRSVEDALGQTIRKKLGKRIIGEEPIRFSFSFSSRASKAIRTINNPDSSSVKIHWKGYQSGLSNGLVCNYMLLADGTYWTSRQLILSKEVLRNFASLIQAIYNDVDGEFDIVNPDEFKRDLDSLRETGRLADEPPPDEVFD